jgi:hypothetical protein
MSRHKPRPDLAELTGYEVLMRGLQELHKDGDLQEAEACTLELRRRGQMIDLAARGVITVTDDGLPAS